MEKAFCEGLEQSGEGSDRGFNNISGFRQSGSNAGIQEAGTLKIEKYKYRLIRNQIFYDLMLTDVSGNYHIQSSLFKAWRRSIKY